MEVSVCVATRRRPAGLAELLRSLAAQDLPEDVSVRVVVVENDDEPDPEVARVLHASDLAVTHVLEPRQGIPYARNTGIAHAGAADVIAFIDDDEVAPERWLAIHLAGLAEHGADVTTGPVLPAFEHDPPGWVAASGIYDRRRWPTGCRRPQAYTGNTACRAEWLTSRTDPFDTDLALTGGSDTELFRRLSHEGARIVWIDEAPVVETVPPERTTLRWVLRRGLRYGGDRWRRSRGAPVRRAAMLAAAMAEVVVGGVAAAVTVPLSRGLAVRFLNRGARGIGVVATAVGLRVEEYR